MLYQRLIYAGGSSERRLIQENPKSGGVSKPKFSFIIGGGTKNREEILERHAVHQDQTFSRKNLRTI